jgi:glutamate carboxypeptidase
MGKPVTLDDALAHLRAHAGALVARTRQWVEINSYTENVAGVNEVGARLRVAFALPSLALTVHVGAEPELVAGTRFGDHLVWKTPAAAAAGAAPILLVGHHDTVFPPGHFEGWREAGDGRAVGPGALDMKGGLSIICGALAALDAAGALSDLPVTVVCVADEEVGSPSSRPVLEAEARGAACALVFESGRVGDMIITRRKGVGSMTVVMHGVAAHAGNNHKDGANAIWALAKFVDAAQSLTDYARGVTVNVGQASGGTSKNTVPERADCALDLRYETVADAEALVSAIRAAATAAAAAVPGVRAEVSGGASRSSARPPRPRSATSTPPAPAPAASATAKRPSSAAAATPTPSPRSASPPSTASARAAPVSTPPTNTSTSRPSSRKPKPSSASSGTAADRGRSQFRQLTPSGPPKRSARLRGDGVNFVN